MSPTGDEPSSTLRARMRPPVVPARYLGRERLDTLLDDVVDVPLALVIAPAGAGKSALVSGWSCTTDRRVAWLSLDVIEADGRRFWTAVINCLAQPLPGLGRRALADLRDQAPLLEVVGALTGDLVDADEDEPVVLVLDDLHLVDHDDEVATTLTWFLERHPAWLHVILLSRREPNLPLDRLRGRGRVGQELRFAALRFSPEESSALLRRTLPSLPETELAAAVTSAGGWAASLLLFALAARTAEAGPGAGPRGSPERKLFEDFVWNEVLAGEADDLVDVLLELAIVERFDGDLARALSDHDDIDELLVRLDNRGLLAPAGEADGWVELPSAVRLALLRELERRSPDRLRRQHARAAEWFESAHHVETAVDHLLRAGRPGQALHALATNVAALYDRGLEAVVVGAVATIPPTAAYEDLESLLEYAWCHALVDRARFVDLVTEATWWADRSELDASTEGHLRVLQSIRAGMTLDLGTCGALAREGIDLLGVTSWQDPLGPFGWSMVARDIALSERWDDGDPEVRDAALALARDRDRRVAFEGTRALGEALAGRPLDAIRLGAGVRHIGTSDRKRILRAEVDLAEAIAHREIGDHDTAVRELTELAEHPVEPMGYVRLLATLELVSAFLDAGDLRTARRWFSTAEEVVVSELPTGVGPDWLGRAGTLVALAGADHESARRWADGMVDPSWRAIGRARVELAEGAVAAATAELDGVVPRNLREEVTLELLRARAVTDHAESLKHVVMAIELAAASGLLQTVASEGSVVVELVERAAWRVPEPWLDRLRRLTTSGAATTVGLPTPRDVLTDRERDVLRFLPSRLTLPEIAQELYVSVNTLKFHLKVIYRKLGVNSRAEAAEAARGMSLLS